jgi:hypothetical protein
MKVVVPYTKLHPVTEFVLTSYRPEYVDVSAPDGYRQFFKGLWERRETVIIVEHDIVPWPGALDELWQCPCTWGSYTYHLHGGLGIHHGFGCTKLSARLMEETSDVWESSSGWNMLDQVLFFEARALGFEPHHHRPAVTHLNPRHWSVLNAE